MIELRQEDEKMKRERTACSDVILKSVDHKINRKAMIEREIAFASWRGTEYIDKCEEAFAETVKTPVGGAVRRYIGL